jgi:hypothetical protein
LLLPLFSVQPSLGGPIIDGLLGYIDPDSMDTKTTSILGGVTLLWQDDDIALALLILVFSVAFPCAKLALLWGSVFIPAVRESRLLRILKAIGPWSMLDIFVVAVTVLAFKSFPGGTRFRVEVGFYLFLVSVVASMFATMLTSFIQPTRAATVAPKLARPLRKWVCQAPSALCP